MVETGLDFGLLGTKQTVQTADYKSAGSNQNEILKTASASPVSTWVVIHTVPTGKTYYVSTIVVSTSADNVLTSMGTGSSGSETTIFSIRLDETAGTGIAIMTLPTPIKFSSGTIISVRTETTNVSWNLIGWEE